MARKSIVVCDGCGKTVIDGEGASLRLTFTDSRRGAKAADVCDACAESIPGHAASRRGRKPKAK